MSLTLTKMNSDSKLVNVLLEMNTYILSGKLDPKQIPMDDIATLLFEEVSSKNYPAYKRNILLGSLDSIIYELKEGTMNANEVACHIRQIIAYFI